MNVCPCTLVYPQMHGIFYVVWPDVGGDISIVCMKSFNIANFII